MTSDPIGLHLMLSFVHAEVTSQHLDDPDWALEQGRAQEAAPAQVAAYGA